MKLFRNQNLMLKLMDIWVKMAFGYSLIEPEVLIYHRVDRLIHTNRYIFILNWNRFIKSPLMAVASGEQPVQLQQLKGGFGYSHDQFPGMPDEFSCHIKKLTP